VALLVLVLVVGVGGYAAAAGVRYAVSYATGNEEGPDILVAPRTGRNGNIRLTVENVFLTRHFTRIAIRIKNGEDSAVTLPIFENCNLMAASGGTLQPLDSRTHWTQSVPPAGTQSGVLVFRRLPEGTTRATLSFITIFGVTPDVNNLSRSLSLTVRGLRMRPPPEP
jgi:hypothetical protein